MITLFESLLNRNKLKKSIDDTVEVIASLDPILKPVGMTVEIKNHVLLIDPGKSMYSSIPPEAMNYIVNSNMDIKEIRIIDTPGGSFAFGISEDTDFHGLKLSQWNDTIGFAGSDDHVIKNFITEGTLGLYYTEYTFEKCTIGYVDARYKPFTFRNCKIGGMGICLEASKLKKTDTPKILDNFPFISQKLGTPLARINKYKYNDEPIDLSISDLYNIGNNKLGDGDFKLYLGDMAGHTKCICFSKTKPDLFVNDEVNKIQNKQGYYVYLLFDIATKQRLKNKNILK